MSETSDSPGRGYLISSVSPALFPLGMRRAGISGEVDVRVTVGKDGLVKDAVILKSSQVEFEQRVLTMARSWRFREIPKPGDGKPVGLIMDCRVTFGFEGD